MKQTTPNEVTLFLKEDDDIDVMRIKREFTRRKIANPIRRANASYERFRIFD
jgi:hypothetical protein